MTSSMGRSNQRLPLAWPMRTVSALTTQVRLSLADACVMMLPLSSPSCPSRRLGGLWPPGSGCRRAQNGNGRRSKKSEHVLRRGISRATTSPSADGADDGRCGQQVVGTKALAAPAPGPFISLISSHRPPTDTRLIASAAAAGGAEDAGRCAGGAAAAGPKPTKSAFSRK